MSGPLFVWDLVVKYETNQDRTKLETIFKTICKKYVYQQEAGGDTGYVHWQCRLDLQKKQRAETLARNLQRSGVSDFHLSPLSSECVGQAKFTYAMKEDTRIDGPWRDTPHQNLPAQFKVSWENPYQWQKAVRELPYDDRSIHIIYDQRGAAGKSTLCRDLCLFGDGVHIMDFKDLNHMCAPIIAKDSPHGPFTIIFDLARVQPNDNRMKIIIDTMEIMKTGHVVDSRYSHKEKWLLTPRVLVFTNWDPKVITQHLSRDRPKVWTIIDKVLVPFGEPMNVDQ